jgi:hypothetical protein
MRHSWLRATVLGVAMAIAAGAGAAPASAADREFIYLYDQGGALVGATLDSKGNFTDAWTLALTGIPGDVTGVATFDTQAVSFSKRLRQVAIATGAVVNGINVPSVTTILVGPLTGRPVPGTDPVEWKIPVAKLIRSVHVVETSSGVFVYALDAGALPGDPNIYGFRMNPSGALTPLPGSPFSTPGGGLATGITHVGPFLIVNFSPNDGATFELQSFRVNAGGILTLAGDAVVSGVNPAVVIPGAPGHPVVYTPDCSLLGLVAGFRVNLSSGQLTPLPGSPYASADLTPCTATTRPETAVVGGGNAATSMQVFRLNAQGVMTAAQAIKRDVPTQVLAFTDVQHLVAVGRNLDGNELTLQMFNFNPARRTLTPVPLQRATQGSVKTFTAPGATTTGKILDTKLTAALKGGQLTLTFQLPPDPIDRVVWALHGILTYLP